MHVTWQPPPPRYNAVIFLAPSGPVITCCVLSRTCSSHPRPGVRRAGHRRAREHAAGLTGAGRRSRARETFLGRGRAPRLGASPRGTLADTSCTRDRGPPPRPPGQTRPPSISTRRTLHLNPSGPPPRRRAQRANSNAPLPPFLIPHAARTQARAAAHACRAARAERGSNASSHPAPSLSSPFLQGAPPPHTRARLGACARSAACARDGSAPRAASFESSAAAFSVNTDGELEAWRARLSSALARRGRCHHCLPPRRGPARRQQACASSTHACCTGRHTGRHVGTPASVRDGNSLISGRFAQSGPAQLHVLPSFLRRRAAASGAG